LIKTASKSTTGRYIRYCRFAGISTTSVSVLVFPFGSFIVLVIVLVMLPCASIVSLVLETTFVFVMFLGFPFTGLKSPWKAAIVLEILLFFGFLPCVPYPTVSNFGLVVWVSSGGTEEFFVAVCFGISAAVGGLGKFASDE